MDRCLEWKNYETGLLCTIGYWPDSSRLSTSSHLDPRTYCILNTQTKPNFPLNKRKISFVPQSLLQSLFAFCLRSLSICHPPKLALFMENLVISRVPFQIAPSFDVPSDRRPWSTSRFGNRVRSPTSTLRLPSCCSTLVSDGAKPW